jgi:cell division protein FtsW
MTCVAIGLLARVSYELTRAENAAAQAVVSASDDEMTS